MRIAPPFRFVSSATRDYLESDELVARLETVENADLEEQECPLFIWRYIDNMHGGVHWRLDHAVPEGGPPAHEVSLVLGIARRPDDQSQATEGDLAGAAFDKGTC